MICLPPERLVGCWRFVRLVYDSSLQNSPGACLRDEILENTLGLEMACLALWGRRRGPTKSDCVAPFVVTGLFFAHGALRHAALEPTRRIVLTAVKQRRRRNRFVLDLRLYAPLLKG